jgi:hypothetical protein
MIIYAMQQIDIDFDANKAQPPPAPSKGGGEICKLQNTIFPL